MYEARIPCALIVCFCRFVDVASAAVRMSAAAERKPCKIKMHCLPTAIRPEIRLPYCMSYNARAILLIVISLFGVTMSPVPFIDLLNVYRQLHPTEFLIWLSTVDPGMH